MDWTEFEIDLIIEDYFSMFQKELRGIPYNKSKHRRALIERLRNRSHSSVEKKHQNISAVLVELDLPYIKGYKPLPKRQQLLADKVSVFISKNPYFIEDFQQFANQKIEGLPNNWSFEDWIVPAPNIGHVEEPRATYSKPFKRNFLELEQRNQSMGLAGEELVYRYEVWRLNKGGNSDLSRKVEWVSKSDDSAGFDIYSKSHDGEDMFIEVKATTLGVRTPIYFSKNENDFSKQHFGNYHLYRVFDLNRKPQMFKKHGSFSQFCSYEAVSFKGHF